MIFLILAVIQVISFFVLKVNDLVTFCFVWGLVPLAILHFSSSNHQVLSYDMKSTVANVDLLVSNEAQEKRRGTLKEKISINKTTIQFILLSIINFIFTAILYNIYN